jgi:hypothetical protein
MEALLHIGTEKTGTTTIQRFLADNRESLLAAGVLVPRSIGSKHHRRLQLMASGAAALGDPWLRMKGIDTAGGLAAAQERWRSDLEREVGRARRAGAERLVVSSEFLQSRLASTDEVARLASLLASVGVDRVRVLVVLREQVATAMSLLSTRVLMGATLVEPPEPDAPGWGTILDHRATIERWAEVLGPEAVEPRLFEVAASHPAGLLGDFTAAAGLDVPGLVLPGPRNESMSGLAIAVVARMNVLHPAPDDEGGDAVRDHAVATIVDAFAQEPRAVPRPELVTAYEQRFAPGNEWVRRARFPERAVLFPPYVAGPVPTRVLDDAELDRLAADHLAEAAAAVAAGAGRRGPDRGAREGRGRLADARRRLRGALGARFRGPRGRGVR